MRPLLVVLTAFALAGCSTSDGGGQDLGASPDLATPADLAPGPTYASFAKGFFTTYCVRCHPSASSTRDFTQYAVIQQNAHLIACGVSPTALAGCGASPAPGQFPVGTGPFPSDDERNALVQWIQAGLPQ